MPREITEHLIPALPRVAELRVFAGEPDQFGIPHRYEFSHDNYDADDESRPIVLALQLQSGDPRKGWNGATTLSILAALVDFIAACQRSKFHCQENHTALIHLAGAIYELQQRVKRREREKTMHTHEVGAGEQAIAAPEKTKGQLAYEGYFAKCGGKSLVNGQPLPSFGQQKPEIQEAWEAAAAAVLGS